MAPGQVSRRTEIIARLDQVIDPELDRSVVAMGFIQDVSEEDGSVRVSFRLPTHWCGANFAFLMANDMQEALESLPWVTNVEVRLLDHFAAGRINDATASHGGFSAVFPGEASGDLEGLRRDFLLKAYVSRQARVLRALVADQGIAATLALRMSDLEALACGEGDSRDDIVRYLALRRRLGGPAEADDLAFTDSEGSVVTTDHYARYMRDSRRIYGTAEANAEHCLLLMRGRAIEPAPEQQADPEHPIPPGQYE